MNHRQAIPIIAALLLAGCAAKTTGTTAAPIAPTPPQITIAQTLVTIATAEDAGVQALIACRQQGKCSPADVTAAENVLAAIARAGKQIDAEMRSPDDWPTQKAAILKLILNSGIAEAKARVSFGTQAVIAGIVTAFDLISAAVGGPTL